MKYLTLLRNPKSLVLLAHSLFRPRWVDAIDRGLIRLLRGKRYRPFPNKATVTSRSGWTNTKARGFEKQFAQEI